jgi:uncharacterized membrane protein (DUF106 family)
MSPKVIIRQNSILVDADTLEPIQDDIVALRKEIEKEKKKKGEKDEKRLEELKQQLQDLLSDAHPLNAY